MHVLMACLPAEKRWLIAFWLPKSAQVATLAVRPSMHACHMVNFASSLLYRWLPFTARVWASHMHDMAATAQRMHVSRGCESAEGSQPPARQESHPAVWHPPHCLARQRGMFCFPYFSGTCLQHLSMHTWGQQPWVSWCWKLQLLTYGPCISAAGICGQGRPRGHLGSRPRWVTSCIICYCHACHAFCSACFFRAPNVGWP